jgi:hypothetical protein
MRSLTPRQAVALAIARIRRVGVRLAGRKSSK